MHTNSETFARWLDNLVGKTLPIEIQVKISDGQDLTADEFKRSAVTIILAALAETLHFAKTAEQNTTELLEIVRRIERRQIEHGKLLRAINLHTLPPLEKGNHIFASNTEVERQMFVDGFRLMLSNEVERPYTAANIVFDDFKRREVTGRYKNKKSFGVLFSRKWEQYNQRPRI